MQRGNREIVKILYVQEGESRARIIFFSLSQLNHKGNSNGLNCQVSSIFLMMSVG